MHEAALVANILEICERVARERDARAIASIRLRVGAFTGVVPEALEFAFEALRPGTLAEAAALELIPEPLVTRCRNCGEASPPDGDFCLFCPTCGEVLEIISGRELLVESIDLQ